MFRYSPQNIIYPSLTPSYVLLPQSPTSYLLIFSSFDFFFFFFWISTAGSRRHREIVRKKPLLSSLSNKNRH